VAPLALCDQIKPVDAPEAAGAFLAGPVMLAAGLSDPSAPWRIGHHVAGSQLWHRR